MVSFLPEEENISWCLTLCRKLVMERTQGFFCAKVGNALGWIFLRGQIARVSVL